MELKTFQEKIVEFGNQWGKKRNFTISEQSTFNHLVEEVGELAREYVNKEERKEKYSDEELKNSIGDAIMHLFILADIKGWDVEEIVTKIIEDEQEMLKE